LRENAAFCDWLISAEKPIGLFAVEDRLGFEVCEVCRELNLRVPLDVAVLGADDDESLCQISHPMLSSVHTPLVQVGLQAAAMLNAMMGRQNVVVESRLLDPIHVTVRETCGILAADDPYIAEVLRRIHANSDQPLTIKQLVKDLPISRRNLEQRFRLAIGRSPMEEVRRICIERAVAMLLNTDEPIWNIAEKCGFGSPVHLSVAFRRVRGMSPREFRDHLRVEQPNDDSNS
jgi:LacI family transcriptional regulator